ncbi:unnamed protein product [Lampetra planeri]
MAQNAPAVTLLPPPLRSDRRERHLGLGRRGGDSGSLSPAVHGRRGKKRGGGGGGGGGGGLSDRVSPPAFCPRPFTDGGRIVDGRTEEILESHSAKAAVFWVWRWGLAEEKE